MARSEWERDCLFWRGRVLTGKHPHYCHDWDGLPVDDTTPEWPCDCWPRFTYEEAMKKDNE